ncbi:CD74 molecule, major histocompatibility complex, class II invariant chain a [Aulostomus maculatus]
MDRGEEDAPLAAGNSHEALVGNVEVRRGSNSRALKIAGLTTLACLLLASQVFTAYMVMGQKQQIQNLQMDSERMGRQLTRPSQVVLPMKVPMAMNSLSLLNNFDDSTASKQSMTKLQDTAVMVTMEEQVKNLLQGLEVPRFSGDFLANMQNLKDHMNETDWKSLETWMSHWLLFQLAQQKPAPPTASTSKTDCQLQAMGDRKFGSFRPQCDEQGRYSPMQCWHATGYCWCVDESGTTVEGTTIRGKPDCQRASPRRSMMAMPMQMEALAVPEEN